MSPRLCVSLCLVLSLIALNGCASRTMASPFDNAPKPSKAAAANQKKPAATAARSAAAKPKQRENVLILEYHKVVPKEARWDRSISRFCNDLHLLYKKGYRPVTMSEYLRGELDSRHYEVKKDNWWDSPVLHVLDAPTSKGLPRGMKPVIFTFDDSHPSQFRLKKDGSLDPDCAVGIWERFARKHPDFPVKATFYVLPTMMWGQRKMLPKKLEILKQWGCEIGSHTYNHRSLGKLTDEQVKKEFAMSILFIEKLGFKPETIALPYGVAPKNGALLKSFKLWGRTFGFKAAVLGGAGPAPMPGTRGFRSYHIPRTQGIDGFLGLNYWVKRADWGWVRMHKSK